MMWQVVIKCAYVADWDKRLQLNSANGNLNLFGNNFLHVSPIVNSRLG